MILQKLSSNRPKIALAYCLEQVRKFDHDRYLCTLFAPAWSRPALWALYAFNLELARTPEMVTQPTLGQLRLNWWREELEGLLKGEIAGHMVIEALGQTWPDFTATQKDFMTLIDGRMLDLSDRPPETLEELERYLEATSATLMRLSLYALNINDARTKVAGREIGLAWGFMGLIRNLPIGSVSRRPCIPSTILSGLGCSPTEKFLGPSPLLNQAVKTLADEAEFHLRKARTLVPEVTKAARGALSLGALLRLYLDRLARAKYNPYADNLRVSVLRRLLALGMAWCQRY